MWFSGGGKWKLSTSLRRLKRRVINCSTTTRVPNTNRFISYAYVEENCMWSYRFFVYEINPFLKYGNGDGEICDSTNRSVAIRHVVCITWIWNTYRRIRFLYTIVIIFFFFLLTHFIPFVFYNVHGKS